MKRLHVLLIGLALATVVLAQGYIAGSGGGGGGSSITAATLSVAGDAGAVSFYATAPAGVAAYNLANNGAWWCASSNCSERMSSNGSGTMTITATSDVSINAAISSAAARGNNINWSAGDAGFSRLSVGGPSSLNAFAVDTAGFVWGRDAGFNDITATQNISAATPRGQLMYWNTGDAGFSSLSAKFYTTSPDTFCNTTGGTQTAACNGKTSGIGRMGTGNYFTIFNTSMPANAYVDATLGTTDASCVSIKSVIVDGGFGAVLTPGTACTTANTIVRWRIVDAPDF